MFQHDNGLMLKASSIKTWCAKIDVEELSVQHKAVTSTPLVLNVTLTAPSLLLLCLNEHKSLQPCFKMEMESVEQGTISAMLCSQSTDECDGQGSHSFIHKYMLEKTHESSASDILALE